MTTATETVCGTCKGHLWVVDAGVDPRPCGDCNAGNWDGPLPYPGWPGPCREYACDDVVHPCALFHDPTACDRPPAAGCGCDFDEPDDPPNARPRDEHPWCEHQYCHDRVHLDGLHTDEHGRFFRDTPEPVYEPHELVYDDDPDTTPPYDEQDAQWPANVTAGRPPRPGTPTPIYDQLVDELYPEHR